MLTDSNGGPGLGSVNAPTKSQQTPSSPLQGPGPPRSDDLVGRRKQFQRADASDSDDSDNDSVSVNYFDEKDFGTKKTKRKQLKAQKSSSEWIILEGLKDGQRCEVVPKKQDGFLLKKRKWPLKGWHKRFFTIEKGLLIYSKSLNDLLRGKLHGEIDIGLSVISYKHHGRRVDIDAEDIVYHIKIKGRSFFKEWIESLRVHRLYRQHEIAYGTSDNPRLTLELSTADDGLPISPDPLEEHRRTLQRDSSLKAPGSSRRSDSFIQRGQSRQTAAWILDNTGIEQCNKELHCAQNQLFSLTDLLAQMHDIQAKNDQVYDGSTPSNESEGAPSKKSGLTWLKSKSKKDKNRPVVVTTCDSCSSISSQVSISSGTNSGSDRTPSGTNGRSKLTADQPGGTNSRPVSMPDSFLYQSDRRLQELQLRENFLSTSRGVQDSLKALFRSLSTERDRFRRVLDQDIVSGPGANNLYVSQLRQSLTEANKQNQDLRFRLSQIRGLSVVTEGPLPAPSTETLPLSERTLTPPRNQLSNSFSMESNSVAEYFDAAEYLGGNPTSSEASDMSEDEDGSSVSDGDTEHTPTTSMLDDADHYNTGRRDKLPAPRANTGDIGLWNLLCRNIGKDLSKIAMPVTLNEPLNMLQRLCEELEYSDLLDKASTTETPSDRMVLIAAFAVSGYAASYNRAGQKPFNPLLGETYECIREDKGWKFVAEQVSHHPPISACFCHSKNFLMWQEARIRTKFWGKSMEIQPIGSVNVELPRFNERYTWNKVTSCVHNILSGQRWVDQYGEMVIKCGKTTCKLVFAKASYWSSRRHEVHGVVTDGEGKAERYIFGKWTEGIYCGHAPSAYCVWRPGSLPEDHELYYGFTRFAMELNEIECGLRPLLPPTDTRFRPDQRYCFLHCNQNYGLLEEGQVKEAESEKLRLEHLQRERRKQRERDGVVHEPIWFRQQTSTGGKHTYSYTGEYWEKRTDHGFVNVNVPQLW